MNTINNLPFRVLGIDHIAVAVNNIAHWKAFYLMMGAVVFYEMSDANPYGTSSMKLCGLKIGDFSLALIEGIDRIEISQVSTFVKKHGDHSFQHVAIAVDNIHAWVEWGQAHGINFLGSVLERKDAFGDVKQLFACKFDPKSLPSESPFYEFVERPNQDGKFASADSFSDDFAQQLFQQVEDAQKRHENLIFLNPDKSDGTQAL